MNDPLIDRSLDPFSQASINRIYGFYDECKRRYSIRPWVFLIFRQIDFDNTKWSEDWDQVDLESVSHESLMGPIDSTILWLKIWEPKTWFWVFFPKF